LTAVAETHLEPCRSVVVGEIALLGIDNDQGRLD
jgi:hypothetical protein